jgi:hypothetical protein
VPELISWLPTPAMREQFLLRLPYYGHTGMQPSCHEVILKEQRETWCLWLRLLVAKMQ